MELTESNPSVNELPGVFKAEELVAILVQVIYQVESDEHASL